MPGEKSLYADYTKSKQLHYEARVKTLDVLRQEHSEARDAIKALYNQKRESVKQNTAMDNKSKRVVYRDFAKQREQAFNEQKRMEKEQKDSVREQYPARTWDEFLIERVKEGDTAALGILRRRRNFRQNINQALLTVTHFDDAKDVIKAHFKPQVLQNGKVIYRVKDGGVVSDEHTAVCVPQVTEAAAVLALSLADERFKGKALVVEGSEAFKLQVAKLSALEGLSIRFADTALQKDRERYLRTKELEQESAKQNKQHVYSREQQHRRGVER